MAAARPVPEKGIGEDQAERLAAFFALLRDNGFRVGLPESGDALRILASPQAQRPSTLKTALRALACANLSDWQRFDTLFDAFWLGRGMRRVQPLRGSGPPSAATRKTLQGQSHADAGGTAGDRNGEGDPSPGSRPSRDLASAVETFAAKDLRHVVDPDEAERAHALAARLARRMRARLVRRERARAHGRRLDLRRTIHHNVAHGGTPVDLIWRQRKRRPLRLVLLLDASGSMETYTAFFLRFIHGAVEAFRESEAFIFHTSLVHVSSALRERDVSRAVDRLSLVAQGMGGGTRIGDSLETFNRWHAARVIHSRTVVIIVSDGYDTGDPARLGEEMARLARRCRRRVVWLNPLIGWRDYRPTARGMQAALPHVDLFAPAHNLESLAALEPYLARV